MVMSYTTLVGPKGSTGSIASWSGYGKLVGEADTILTEAQSLLFQSLRIREMRSEFVFGMAVGASRAALPARFLDPIGRLRDTTFGGRYKHSIESEVTTRRMFNPLSGGALGSNPFLTGSANASTVTANIVAHTLTQGSDVSFAGATSPVDGIGVNGTFLVTSVPDVDHVVFTTDDQATAGAITGGGAAVTWSGNQLIQGSPVAWSIWDELLQFDQAFDTATQFRLLCFKSPRPLSTQNPTNFLTARYPLLLRKACQAAAADFMEETEEYNKAVSALGQLIQATNAESDLMYRGADLDTETP